MTPGRRTKLILLLENTNILIKASEQLQISYRVAYRRHRPVTVTLALHLLAAGTLSLRNILSVIRTDLTGF